MKYSIIIPAYNAQKTIERCVQSILNNSYRNFEVIIIEDCSKDDTYIICKKLAENDRRIRLLRNDRNSGVSYTRNQGLNIAKGEYLLFVDSDDWVEQDYIDCFERQLKYDPETMIVCGYLNDDEKYNSRQDIVCWNQKEEIYTKEETLMKLFEKNLLQQLWNKVFLREVIEKHHIRFDESISIGEDLRFILEYLHNKLTISITPIKRTPYHYMRDNENSLMYQVGNEKIDESLYNMRKLYELIGMSEEECDLKVEQEKEHLIQVNAYLIMHNRGMNFIKKRRLILNIDKAQGTILFRKNLILYFKEKIYQYLQH
ncbi:Beta-1,3-glucosyltransferase [Lachnospiraceae bacterium TWA4]|nr:Beta-1,3-glucosyltransferase [Lachnospiraceae bacterium TWA4]